MCRGTCKSSVNPTIRYARRACLLTFPLRFFSRLYWQTYSSSVKKLSVRVDACLQAAVHTDTTRARSLSVTSGSHAVAMVAGAAHSALDGSRASALELGNIGGGSLHCCCVRGRIVVVHTGTKVAINHGGKCLSGHGILRTHKWVAEGTIECRGTTSESTYPGPVGPKPGSDLWLECSMRPQGLQEARSRRE